MELMCDKCGRRMHFAFHVTPGSSYHNTTVLCNKCGNHVKLVPTDEPQTGRIHKMMELK